MYVLRPALRASSGRPPARYVCGRRYPSCARLRPFHTSPRLARASDPPTNPGNTPIDQDGVDQAAGKKTAAAGQTEASLEGEDPDQLAQKLQRARETSRRYSAALRRQQRGKKASGLAPVHIPDWFLKRRVSLRYSKPQDRHIAQGGLPVLSVSVSHADSGEHATCTIPAELDFDAADVLSRLVRGLWSRRLDDQEKRKVEKYLQENMTGNLQADAVESQTGEATSTSSATTTNQENEFLADPSLHGEKITDAEAMIKVLEKLKSSLRDMRETEEHVPKHDTRMKTATAAMKRSMAKLRQVGATKCVSPLVVAEIRSTVAASFSTLQPASSDSFPAAKTNVLLHSPSPEHEKSVEKVVNSIATEMNADVITLHAQDLAQLAGDYLGEGNDPSPRSVRSLGYETYRLSADLQDSFGVVDEIGGEDESDPTLPSATDPSGWQSGAPRAFAIPLSALTPALKALTQGFGRSMSLNPQYDASTSVISEDVGKTQSQNDLQLEDLKIAALLEALMDANELKQHRGLFGSENAPKRHFDAEESPRPIAFFDYSLNSQGVELDMNSTLPVNAKATISMSVKASTLPKFPRSGETTSKIIHVKDFKEMNATHYGGRILQKLEELVRKRRAAGERIMIIGSTCSRDLTPDIHASGVRGLQGDGESSFFRTIVVAGETPNNEMNLALSLVSAHLGAGSSDASFTEKSKFRRINILHIQDMLRVLDPGSTVNLSDMEQSSQHFKLWYPIFSAALFNRVYTYDEVHRIALTALGLHSTSSASSSPVTSNDPQMNWAHVALAIGLLHASDMTKYSFFERLREAEKTQNAASAAESLSYTKKNAGKQMDEKSLQRQRELNKIASTANKHEKRLMPGIANPDQIKTTFDQVHVPKETVESIRTITSLSLLRPEAFSYGILATEKISGALLYGPPGTGKTLLAKAVAKESGSTVLEVSGSQIMDKYVGEGEKNVAAIFSLARKLSPCIVFLDEADAVFASRDAMRERMSHRDILNQFLKEWDGLNDLSVFVMVATNRPFDLDDAVIRRLPRRLLVDLPTQADRKEILKIHLKGEQLDDSVDLEDLAKRTPFYSGSDLKNVAVSAALACVKEENEQAALAAAKFSSDNVDADSVESSLTDTSASTSVASDPAPSTPPHLVRGQSYTFPEKRILHARHFDKALQEISASISEDMSSLSAIKKFDEQYGDRKGNKRRKDFGFGVLAERNESAARVRI